MQPRFGVSKQHSQGLFGKGIKVQVIDTGLNATQIGNANIVSRSFSNAGGTQAHGNFVMRILGQPQTGICPEATIYMNDIDNSKGVIQTSQLVSAILDAIQLQVDILCISLGTPEQDKQLNDVIQKAHERGILVFAAAGNCGCRSYEYPAACENAISVGSINADRQLSHFNSRNDNISIFAPGENLRLPSLSEKESVISGTSFACPFAAGLAALILQKIRSSNASSQRPSRKEMIQILRNQDHLDLSCSLHNYARSNGCSEGGVSDKQCEVNRLSFEVFKSSVRLHARDLSFSIGLGVLLALIALIVWSFFLEERRQMTFLQTSLIFE